MLHGGIVCGNYALREHRNNGCVQTRLVDLCPQALLQQVADLSLGRGIADIQWKPRDLTGATFGAKQGCSYLRTVTVSQNDAIAGLNEADDLDRSPPRIGTLLADGPLLARSDQRIPAHGKKDGSHSGSCLLSAPRAG
jgi:hypothetical protein